MGLLDDAKDKGRDMLDGDNQQEEPSTFDDSRTDDTSMMEDTDTDRDTM